MFYDEHSNSLEQSQDISDYVILFIDKTTYDRDFLDPNDDLKLSIRTTFNQNINSLTVKTTTLLLLLSKYIRPQSMENAPYNTFLIAGYSPNSLF